MFPSEQNNIETSIKDFCSRAGIPAGDLKWSPIPFSGEWGISTSFFQIAADEARSGKKSELAVPQRAQQIAEQPAMIV